MTVDMEFLEKRYRKIEAELSSASEGKYPVPQILPATKTQSVETILSLRKFGITEIGENRVQEFLEKAPDLSGQFRVHMIGNLQSNKVKYIINQVEMIHSLDRISLAQEIDRQAQMHQRVMPVLIQVNIGREPQKGGLSVEDVIPFVQTVRHLQGLHVCGLMAMMPKSNDTALLSSLFAQMRTLFEHLRDTAPSGVEMRELSMGMSNDYQLAAAHGATMVRIGSALFGERQYPV